MQQLLCTALSIGFWQSCSQLLHLGHNVRSSSSPVVHFPLSRSSLPLLPAQSVQILPGFLLRKQLFFFSLPVPSLSSAARCRPRLSPLSLPLVLLCWSNCEKKVAILATFRPQAEEPRTQYEDLHQSLLHNFLTRVLCTVGTFCFEVPLLQVDLVQLVAGALVPEHPADPPPGAVVGQALHPKEVAEQVVLVNQLDPLVAVTLLDNNKKAPQGSREAEKKTFLGKLGVPSIKSNSKKKKKKDGAGEAPMAGLRCMCVCIRP